MKSKILLFVSLILVSSVAVAEDVNTIFSKVNTLIEAENYPKAIEELGWAKKEIEKLHFKKLETLLPAEIGEFKGDAAKSQSALGMTNVEKTYRNGPKQLRLALTGTGGNQAGGLAALGRMAAMMGGNTPGMDTFRIDGRTAHLQVKDAQKRAEVSIYLDSGSVLKLELNNTQEGSELKTLAESIKVGEIDNYLRGVQG